MKRKTSISKNERLYFTMEKGNVLVIGNSGVGKSTLINAVLGEDRALTGYGTKGTTQYLELYESDNVPFRIIDSVGFEPSFIKRQKAIKAVKKWSNDSAKTDGEDKQINMIWFCVDGTSRKLFPEAIKNLTSATSLWKSIPIIVVITKSYSIPEREENIAMVQKAFDEQKKCQDRLRNIIPVVADTYVINDNAYAPPSGIEELINITNDLMPEGIKAAENDVYNFILTRKRAFAHSVAIAATAGGVAIGAIPIPFADAAILTPLETAEINTLASIYGINKNEKSKVFINSIVEVGTVSAAAKAAISALKLIPGINIGASVLNAIIAGCIVAAIGEGSIFAFEQVYLGHKTLDDIAWVKQIIESKLASGFVEKVQSAVEAIGDNTDNKNISTVVSGLFYKKNK